MGNARLAWLVLRFHTGIRIRFGTPAARRASSFVRVMFAVARIEPLYITSMCFALAYFTS